MRELSDLEIEQVAGGTRVKAVVKALDWVGRALAAAEVGKAVSKMRIDVTQVTDPMDTKLGINTGAK